MQSDVLSDRTISTRAGINFSDFSAPIELPEGITLERKLLLSAFQRAADHEPIPDLIDANGIKHDICVDIEGESASLTYGTNHIRFALGALLTAVPDRRLATGSRCLSNNTLSEQARQKFIEIVGKPGFAHDDFFAACNILQGSPKSFANSLREATKKGVLSKNDFLPEETAHWRNITATPSGSEIAALFHRAGAFGRTRCTDSARPVPRGRPHFADIRSAGTCSLEDNERNQCRILASGCLAAREIQ